MQALAMVNETLDSLPDAPANLAGESIDKGARYHIKVSNAAGYLCHIHMEVVALPLLVGYGHFVHATVAL